MANNDVVVLADITKLKYLTALNGSGTAYTTFDFEVHDGTAYADAAETMTIDVAAVNDAPTSSASSVNAVEDVVFLFAPITSITRTWKTTS